MKMFHGGIGIEVLPNKFGPPDATMFAIITHECDLIRLSVVYRRYDRVH